MYLLLFILLMGCSENEHFNIDNEADSWINLDTIDLMDTTFTDMLINDGKYIYFRIQFVVENNEKQIDSIYIQVYSYFTDSVAF